MRPRAARKFTILDAMILVAAAAGGLALGRTTGFAHHYGVVSEQNWLGRMADDRLNIGLGIPFLITLTPAVLILRLNRPRPRWRRLTRQPGGAACCAAIVPIAVTWLQAFWLNRSDDHVIFAGPTSWDHGELSWGALGARPLGLRFHRRPVGPRVLADADSERPPPR